ncbi:hypothetical protein T492DRAFT_933334 [Pavlovales sp. CCMP2436]|nr:hypothetical protein T492DRAFT_933334 [Pavlovales sp. CCMP2436]
MPIRFSDNHRQSDFFFIFVNHVLTLNLQMIRFSDNKCHGKFRFGCCAQRPRHDQSTRSARTDAQQSGEVREREAGRSPGDSPGKVREGSRVPKARARGGSRPWSCSGRVRGPRTRRMSR